LNDLIAELERDWQLVVVSCLKGGSEACVAEAKTRDGSEAILKIALPEMEGNTVLAHEIVALAVADGRGYARLLKHDLGRRALLLERLGVPLKDLGYSTSDQMNIICAALRESWTQNIPSGTPLPTGAGAAGWFAAFISGLWEKLGKPCSRRAIDMALSFTESRAAAFHLETSVLVHGDAHHGNILQVLSQNRLIHPRSS
jgi:streptomycin 6-kinase